MSFLRKFVSKLQMKKRSSDLLGDDAGATLTQADSLEDDLPPPLAETRKRNEVPAWEFDTPSERLIGSVSSATSLDLEHSNDCGLSASTSSLDRKLGKCRKSLNKKLDKYRRERWRVTYKAAQVQHLQDEITSVMQMLSQLRKQKNLLEIEKNNKLREMMLACKLVPEEVSPELRKKEPLQFKKYHNAKTVADAQSLLQNIHLKQRALQHLEVMTFKKMLEFEHRGFTNHTKNNNNMIGDESIEKFMEDMITRFQSVDIDSTRRGFASPGFVLKSSSVLNTVGPMAYDNPLFESML